MRVWSALFLLVLSLGCPVGAQETTKQKRKAKRPAVPEGVRVVRDLPYASYRDASGTQVPLKLDLYLPVEIPDGPLPAVIWVHGGGWKQGSKEKCKATWLAAEGFAVVSINYRLIDVAGWPAQIDDCLAAVKWVRTTGASDYGISPEKVGAWGSSAGGHLVALMGTRGPRDVGEPDAGLMKVQAVCDWFGPTDLLTMPPNVVGNGRTEEDVARSNGAKLLRGTVRDQPEKAKDASAIAHVAKGNAAFLIMHGDEDPGVPLAQSTRFHESLVKAGVDSTLHVVKGGGHGGPLFSTPEVRTLVRTFFEAKLKQP